MNESSKQYDWIHIYGGQSVPPIGFGSYNYLINELLLNNTNHLFVGKYYPAGFKSATENNISAFYIDYDKKLKVKDRIKSLISNRSVSTDRDFVNKACAIINKIDCPNLLIWGSIKELPYFRWAFPEKTIAYAHRWYTQPNIYDANNYIYCDYLLTLTKGIAKRALEQTYNLPPIIVTIPNGVNLQEFSPITADNKKKLRKSNGIPTDKTVIIFPSKVQSNKGIDYLREWIKYFSATNPNIYFIITGNIQPGKIYGETKNFLNRLKNSYNVKWINGVNKESMAKYYQLSDFSIIPSVVPEGMSNAALESLACGLPVICSNRGALKEFIFNEYNGIVCASEDLYISGIKSINQLAENPSLLLEMSRNARNYSVKRTSIERALTNYQAFFDMRIQDIDNDLTP